MNCCVDTIHYRNTHSSSGVFDLYMRKMCSVGGLSRWELRWWLSRKTISIKITSFGVIGGNGVMRSYQMPPARPGTEVNIPLNIIISAGCSNAKTVVCD